MENASVKKQRGLLIVLSGPSGVGKGTVRRVLMHDRSLHLSFSVSMTTRERRVKEREGREYYFVSHEEFKKSIEEGNLLEYTQFVGNYYGTPKDKIEKLRDMGKNVILEIEVNGATQVIEKYGKDNVVSIYLLPPTFEDLEARIRHRSTETEEVIQQRLAKASKEMLLKGNYKYNVINDDVEKAARQIAGIIRKERKLARNK